VAPNCLGSEKEALLKLVQLRCIAKILFSQYSKELYSSYTLYRIYTNQFIHLVLALFGTDILDIGTTKKSLSVHLLIH